MTDKQFAYLRYHLRAFRRMMITHIKRRVKSKLHTCGYGDVLMAYFPSRGGKDGYSSAKLDLTVIGFTQNCIATDAWGGGLCVTAYIDLSTEQLMFVKGVADKHWEKLQ